MLRYYLVVGIYLLYRRSEVSGVSWRIGMYVFICF